MLRWSGVIFWGALGLTALVSSIWVDWFIVELAFIRFNLGWPALAYAGVILARNLTIRPHLQITQRELHDFGDKLVAATPEIVNLLGKGISTKDVAERMESNRGIPRLLTLKYIIALGNHQKKKK